MAGTSHVPPEPYHPATGRTHRVGRCTRGWADLSNCRSHRCSACAADSQRRSQHDYGREESDATAVGWPELLMYRQSRITLRLAERTVLDVVLEVGQTSQTVE